MAVGAGVHRLPSRVNRSSADRPVGPPRLLDRPALVRHSPHQLGPVPEFTCENGDLAALARHGFGS